MKQKWIFFLEFFCFLYDPTNVANLISGSSVFSKPSLYIGIPQLTYCWRLAWRTLSKILHHVKWEQWNCSLNILGIVLLWIWIENWHFPVLEPLLWFPNLLLYWVQHLYSIIFFRIWNSSAGIPSPPLALFIVMLPKAPLTSHSRMSGSQWVITSLWLSRSLRFCCFFFFF